MVRVLFVTDTFYPRVDGIIRFMEEVHSRLKDDFDIKFLAPKLKSGYLTAKRRGMKVFFCEPFRIAPAGFKSGRPNKKIIAEAIDWADLIFVNTPGGTLGASVIFAAKGKKKLIGYAHTVDWELFHEALGKNVTRLTLKPLLILYANAIDWSLFSTVWMTKKRALRSMLRKIYSKLDLILVPDSTIAKEYRRNGITSKFKVVPIGPNLERFKVDLTDRLRMRKRLEVSNNFVVGYHGRLSKEKNIKLLVDSFNAFKQSHPNAKLLVLGDGPEKKSLRGEDIISPGFVSDPERYLRAMDAYLFLSKTETSALALMEAIASGVPVVATNVGLVSTYVKDGKGILLKPADLKRHLVVKALDMIYNSPKAMKVMSKGALKEMNKKRSWYRVAKDLKKIFKETV